MDLYKEILTEVLSRRKTRVIFENVQIDAAQIVEMECYQALKKIQTVIEDDSLDDNECFMKMEKIIETFESLGSPIENRHDFG